MGPAPAVTQLCWAVSVPERILGDTESLLLGVNMLFAQFCGYSHKGDLDTGDITLQLLPVPKPEGWLYTMVIPETLVQSYSLNPLPLWSPQVQNTLMLLVGNTRTHTF